MGKQVVDIQEAKNVLWAPGKDNKKKQGEFNWVEYRWRQNATRGADAGTWRFAARGSSALVLRKRSLEALPSVFRQRHY